MAKKVYPEGYPLAPVGADGRTIEEGDKVEVLVIPDSLLDGLERDAQAVLEGCKGRVLTVYEIDDYGFMWVEIPVLRTGDDYDSHHFSLEPACLRKVE